MLLPSFCAFSRPIYVNVYIHFSVKICKILLLGQGHSRSYSRESVRVQVKEGEKILSASKMVNIKMFLKEQY